MEKGGRRPIKLDLEQCYSGFNVEELQYIDYTRSILEEASDDPSLEYATDVANLLDADFSNLQDFDEYTREDLKSYLCSTPTFRRRDSGGCIPQDADLSEIHETDGIEFGRNFSKKFGSRFLPRSDSMVSLFDDIRTRRTVPGSVESLNTSEGNPTGPSCGEDTRRKIELDSDLQHDPNKIDYFELSIEEEDVDNLSKIGTLRRKLSIKSLRRHTSTGLFGSYLQRNRSLISAENERMLPPRPTHSSGSGSNGHGPNGIPRSGPSSSSNSSNHKGPLNFWFRKFRSRHFI